MLRYQLPMSQWKEIKGWYGFDASCRRWWDDNYFLQATQETFENLEQNGCMVINSNIVLLCSLAVANVIFKYQRTILWSKVKWSSLFSFIFQAAQENRYLLRAAQETIVPTHMLPHWYWLGPRPSEVFFQYLQLHDQDDLQSVKHRSCSELMTL